MALLQPINAPCPNPHLPQRAFGSKLEYLLFFLSLRSVSLLILINMKFKILSTEKTNDVDPSLCSHLKSKCDLDFFRAVHFLRNLFDVKLYLSMSSIRPLLQCPYALDSNWCRRPLSSKMFIVFKHLNVLTDNVVHFSNCSMFLILVTNWSNNAFLIV